MTQSLNPFGNDMAIVSQGGMLDLLPAMNDITGLQVLIQSVVMRQTTPTGSCIWVPNDCLSVPEMLSKGMTQAQLNQIGPAITSELQKDQRIITANVKATFDFASSTLTLVEVIQSTLGPFTLTLTLTPSSVSFIVSQQGAS
jgi:hypothetical protein